MDKNTIIGFVLIAVVLIGFSWWSQPSAEEQRAAFVQDSIAQVARQKAEKQKQMEAAARQTAVKTKVLEDTTALFYSALTGQQQNIVLKNKAVELTFSSKGATVEKAVIKGYGDRLGNKQLTLFDEKDQSLNYTLTAKEVNISTQDLYFQPSEVTDSSVVFTAQAGTGKCIVISYTLGKNYMLHMKMNAIGMAGIFAPTTSTMDVDWLDKCRQQEKGYTFENRYATLTYHVA